MKPPTELTADEIKSLVTWWPGGRRETIGGGRAWTERETGGMVQPRDSGTVLQSFHMISDQLLVFRSLCFPSTSSHGPHVCPRIVCVRHGFLPSDCTRGEGRDGLPKSLRRPKWTKMRAYGPQKSGFNLTRHKYTITDARGIIIRLRTFGAMNPGASHYRYSI